MEHGFQVQKNTCTVKFIWINKFQKGFGVVWEHKIIIIIIIINLL